MICILYWLLTTVVIFLALVCMPTSNTYTSPFTCSLQLDFLLILTTSRIVLVAAGPYVCVWGGRGGGACVRVCGYMSLAMETRMLTGKHKLLWTGDQVTDLASHVVSYLPTVRLYTCCQLLTMFIRHAKLLL